MISQRNLLILFITIALASAIFSVLVLNALDETQQRMRSSHPGAFNQFNQIDRLLDRLDDNLDEMTFHAGQSNDDERWSSCQLAFDLLWGQIKVFDIKAPGRDAQFEGSQAFHQSLSNFLEKHDPIFIMSAPPEPGQVYLVKKDIQAINRTLYDLATEHFLQLGVYRDDLAAQVRKMDKVLEVTGLLFLFSSLLAFVMLFLAKRKTDASMAQMRLSQQQLENALNEIRSGKREKKERDSLLAAATHDLRQPLHALGLFLSSLNRYVSNPAGLDILNKARTSTEALSRLLSSLLDLSRLDAGVVEVKPVHFPVADVLTEVEREYRQVCEDRDIRLSVSNCGCIIYCDPVLLSRVIKNLVENAIRHSGTDRIDIQCQKRVSSVNLRIVDFGVGIPIADHNNVFSEYYQLQNPERDRNKGLGLGLSIVKRLCELMRIPYAMKSASGSGTRFDLTIQQGASDLLAVSASTPSNAQQLLEGQTIVVIDDDLDVLEAMKSVLKDISTHLICAENATDAVQEIVKHELQPNVLVVDYRLRDGKTGMEAIELIRDELNYDVPAIIVTGDTHPARVREISSHGIKLLHKPVNADELVDAISEQIAHYDLVDDRIEESRQLL